MNNKDNHSTKSNKELIELRSANTRHFIEEEPPFNIRWGTTIIVVILIVILIPILLYYQTKLS